LVHPNHSGAAFGQTDFLHENGQTTRTAKGNPMERLKTAAPARLRTARPVTMKPVQARNAAAARPPARSSSRAGRQLVRDLMTETVFTVSPADDLATLYDLMDSRHVRHVPVVEDEELVGLVTSTELSRSALGKVDELPLSEERAMLRRRHVRDIMLGEPDTIEPDSLLQDAAELLLESKIGCLPVVEGLRLVGIITEADFVSDFLKTESRA
jgi:CBS domain-containing membrane protein